MCLVMKNERHTEWINLGGQNMHHTDVDTLRKDIAEGKLKSWNEIHNRYDDLWNKYSLDKQKHAFATLSYLLKKDNFTKDEWISVLDKALKIQNYVSENVYLSRKKDFDNHFRHITFRNIDEMKAALGDVDEDSFIVQVRQETKEFEKLIEDIKRRN